MKEIDLNKDLLKRKRIAILLAQGFDLEEYEYVAETLKINGAKICLISDDSSEIAARHQAQHDGVVIADAYLQNETDEGYDALVISGHIGSAEDKDTNLAKKFINGFIKKGKPVFAGVTGALTLSAVGLVKNIKVTSLRQYKETIQEMGGKWTEENMVSKDKIYSCINHESLDDCLVPFIDAVHATVAV